MGWIVTHLSKIPVQFKPCAEIMEPPQRVTKTWRILYSDHEVGVTEFQFGTKTICVHCPTTWLLNCQRGQVSVCFEDQGTFVRGTVESIAFVLSKKSQSSTVRSCPSLSLLWDRKEQRHGLATTLLMIDRHSSSPVCFCGCDCKASLECWCGYHWKRLTIWPREPEIIRLTLKVSWNPQSRWDTLQSKRIRLGKVGQQPWMHRIEWPEGWFMNWHITTDCRWSNSICLPLRLGITACSDHCKRWYPVTTQCDCSRTYWVVV
jgi:hypothetical protein